MFKSVEGTIDKRNSPRHGEVGSLENVSAALTEIPAPIRKRTPVVVDELI